jgi:N-acetylglutamate synthase-like GNAT family acetyltransferase
MSSVEYRKAVIEDTEVLIQLRIDALVEYWGNQPGDLLAELKKNLKEYFTKHLSSGSYEAIIAEAGGKIAGVGGITVREQVGNFKNPSGKIGLLMNMFTVPEFRHRGICHNILTMLIEIGRAKGLSVFELYSSPEGESVYEKHGFIRYADPLMVKFIK